MGKHVHGSALCHFGAEMQQLKQVQTSLFSTLPRLKVKTLHVVISTDKTHDKKLLCLAITEYQ